jgi:hypothetical protein
MARNKTWENIKVILVIITLIQLICLFGQALLLLFFLFVSKTVSHSDPGLKAFWWFVIIYSFAFAIYFKFINKGKWLNTLSQLSYIVVIYLVFLYRVNIIKPAVLFSTSFQLFILLTSLLYPVLILSIKNHRFISKGLLSTKRQTVISEPSPSMSDDEMKSILRREFAVFLTEHPDTISIKSKCREVALKSGNLKHFIEDILFPEFEIMQGSFLRYGHIGIVLANMDKFCELIEMIIPEMLSLSNQVQGYLDFEIAEITDNMGDFFIAKLNEIKKRSWIYFAYLILVELKQQNPLIFKGIITLLPEGINFGNEPVYAFVDNLNVHEFEVNKIKEYKGSKGYSIGTTLRLGDGIPPLRLGTFKSAPEYSVKNDYKTTFDMTGTLICMGSELRFINSNESYHIPYKKIDGITSNIDEDTFDIEFDNINLKVLCNDGVTWKFEQFPKNINLLRAFRSVIQAAVLLYNKNDLASLECIKCKVFTYGIPQSLKHLDDTSNNSEDMHAPDSQTSQNNLTNKIDLPEPDKKTMQNNPKEVKMSGNINYISVSKNCDVVKENLIEFKVSDTNIYLKWAEEGDEERLYPCLNITSSDGIHYAGIVEYPIVTRKYHCTLIRYSNKSSALLLGSMEGEGESEGERYVCWFELPTEEL